MNCLKAIDSRLSPREWVRERIKQACMYVSRYTEMEALLDYLDLKHEIKLSNSSKRHKRPKAKRASKKH